MRLCAEVAVRQPALIQDADDTKMGVFALFHRLQQPFTGLEQGSDSASASGRLKESLTGAKRQLHRHVSSAERFGLGLPEARG